MAAAAAVLARICNLRPWRPAAHFAAVWSSGSIRFPSGHNLPRLHAQWGCGGPLTNDSDVLTLKRCTLPCERQGDDAVNVHPGGRAGCRTVLGQWPGQRSHRQHRRPRSVDRPRRSARPASRLPDGARLTSRVMRGSFLGQGRQISFSAISKLPQALRRALPRARRCLRCAANPIHQHHSTSCSLRVCLGRRLAITVAALAAAFFAQRHSCTAAAALSATVGPDGKLLGSFQCLVLCTSLTRSPHPTAQFTNFPPCVFQAVPSALAAAVLAAVIGVVIMA